jgi:hypothetical protein
MTSYSISTGKIKPDTWMIKIQKGQYLKVKKRGTRFVIQRKIEWQLQRQLAAQKAAIFQQQPLRLILPHNLLFFHHP